MSFDLLDLIPVNFRFPKIQKDYSYYTSKLKFLLTLPLRHPL